MSVLSGPTWRVFSSSQWAANRTEFPIWCINKSNKSLHVCKHHIIIYAFYELYRNCMNTFCPLDVSFILIKSFPRCKIELTDTRWHGDSEVISVEVNDNSPDVSRTVRLAITCTDILSFVTLILIQALCDDDCDKLPSFLEVIQNGYICKLHII